MRARLVPARSALLMLLALVLVTGSIVVVLTRTNATAEGIIDDSGLHFSLGDIRFDGPPGIAPVGTRATARQLTDQPADAPFASASREPTTAFELELDGGLQPAIPISVSFSASTTYSVASAQEANGPDDVVPTLLTRTHPESPTTMIPATYDAASGRVTATLYHLTPFWEWPTKAGEFGEAVGAAILGATRRPDCHGEPVIDRTGQTVIVALPERQTVWVCLRQVEDGIAVDLTNTSPTPFELRAAPQANLQQQGATGLADALVVALAPRINQLRYGDQPGAGVLPVRGQATYEFPLDALPAQVALRSDPAAHLISVFASAAEQLSRIAAVDLSALLASDGVLDCVADVTATTDATVLDPTRVADFLRSALTCIPPLLLTLAPEIADKFGLVTYLALNGVPQIVGSITGIGDQLLGPQRILVEPDLPDPPCTSEATFEEWIKILGPDVFGTEGFEAVATPANTTNIVLHFRCIEEHAIGGLVTADGTGGALAVIRPVEGYWGLAVFPPGEGCGEPNEYPPAVNSDICDP